MVVVPARKLGHNDPLKIAIADDSGLIYSDDYRDGWPWGFEGVGCDVKVFDIRPLRGVSDLYQGPYRSNVMRGTPKMLAETVAAWGPDLLFSHHGRSASHSQFLQTLRRHGIPTAVYLCDEPYESGETAIYSPRFDFVFTMDPCTIHAHQKSRADRTQRVFYLPVGVNIDRFRPIRDTERDIPVFFLGNMSLTPRPQWLKPVEDLIEGADLRYWPVVRGSGLVVPVAKGQEKWIPLEEHSSWFNRAQMGLNVHRDPGITAECFRKRVHHRPAHMPKPAGFELADQPPINDGTGFWNDGNLPANHVSPRFFEMAACGALVISDASRSELGRLFPMAPRASDSTHFLELVLYYREHPEEGEELAKACSSRVLKRHTYLHRAAEILIRVGLKESTEDRLATSLGEPGDWLSHQDFNEQGEASYWEAIGPSKPWSPAYGRSSISTSGNISEATSLDAPIPWSL
jgi:spore maturation protein CgeB